MTAQARRLFPRPLLRFASPILGLAAAVVGMIVALVPALWADVLKSRYPSTASRALAEAALLTPLALIAAGLCAIGFTRMRRRARVRRGLADALPLWRAGWYCGRCDGAFFSTAEYPRAPSADQLLPPEVFQQLVWSAGGYTTWGKPVRST